MREALAWAAAGRGRVYELFVTDDARHAELVRAAVDAGVPVSPVTDRAAAALSETVTPQGVVAVCSPVDVPLEVASRGARLVAVLHGVSDPGNAGTVVRVADAAGADAVLFAGDTVDPHNGKCVRASTGSVFHLPVARSRSADEVFAACRAAGLRLIAADGYAPEDLVTADLRGDLTRPTAWVFGSEAHGLPDEVVASLDASLKVPIYGGAESLNLATAAAVCLYASARAHRA
ncbi:TrmH family RNA methyltransferase [Saccharothrix violaceirubra]|uniref:TrmH family RNA methyltransferase n=1 Tax=Saccharothrix violaceirubra TaxID=413306 RepID=A0A7W7WVB5_9PSEU|nr:TrmH family RNA methyltransferase [Saccharothrix violaceirubra]